MCMQCGVCSGSCPMQNNWEHPPQELFMMIRANKREEVLTSTSMWMCTSCYNCIARCPRGLPITHIMHGLATYAKRLNLVPKEQPTAKFAQLMWDNLTKKGRTNELKLGLSLYFMNGIGEGIKKSLAMKDIGLGMMKTGRLSPMEFFGGHGVKDTSGLKKMLAKAQEIEEQHIAGYKG
ncbi:MAG: 4Fe-4S dicluster domain-containing protein, partial [Gammaproteobacteria bacterium]|nr:4Fe-4S dicluster domain-containing protein [Gammaproteobacteria bacterium]